MGVTPKIRGTPIKNDGKVKVLRMGFPIVEILSGLQENIVRLFGSPQLQSGEKSKIVRFLLSLFFFAGGSWHL